MYPFVDFFTCKYTILTIPELLMHLSLHFGTVFFIGFASARNQKSGLGSEFRKTDFIFESVGTFNHSHVNFVQFRQLSFLTLILICTDFVSDTLVHAWFDLYRL